MGRGAARQTAGDAITTNTTDKPQQILLSPTPASITFFNTLSLTSHGSIVGSALFSVLCINLKKPQISRKYEKTLDTLHRHCYMMANFITGQCNYE